MRMQPCEVAKLGDSDELKSRMSMSRGCVLFRLTILRQDPKARNSQLRITSARLRIGPDKTGFHTIRRRWQHRHLESSHVYIYITSLNKASSEEIDQESEIKITFKELPSWLQQPLLPQ